jgi:hypothetical protein
MKAAQSKSAGKMKNPTLKILLTFLLVLGVLTTYTVSRYLTSPSKAYRDKFIRSHPGKPVLLVVLDKEIYSSSDPINYRFVLLNDGDQTIFLPVLRCLDYERISEVNVIPHTLIVTDQDGVKIPSMFDGKINSHIHGCDEEIMALKPHEAVPCVDCKKDARYWLIKNHAGNDMFDTDEYNHLLRQPGVYYLQIGYESSGDTANGQPVWKGLVLSNTVRFVIQ